MQEAISSSHKKLPRVGVLRQDIPALRLAGDTGSPVAAVFTQLHKGDRLETLGRHSDRMIRVQCGATVYAVFEEDMYAGRIDRR